MLPAAAPLAPLPQNQHSPVQQSTPSRSPCHPGSGSPLSQPPARHRSVSSQQSRSVPFSLTARGPSPPDTPFPQPCSCPYLFVSSRVRFPEALHLAEGDVGAVTQPAQEGAGRLLCGSLFSTVLLHTDLSTVTRPLQTQGPRLQLIVQLHCIHRQVTFLCGDEGCVRTVKSYWSTIHPEIPPAPLPSQPDWLGWSSSPACGIQVLLRPNEQKHRNNCKELLILVKRNQSTIQSSPLMEESITSTQMCPGVPRL